MNETYLCTRPKLAARLISAGYPCLDVVNPWHPELDAWEFPMGNGLEDIVAAFYREIGKPIPATLAAGHGKRGAE